MGRGAALSSASASAPRGLRRSSFDVFLRCQHLPVPRAWAAPPPRPPRPRPSTSPASRGPRVPFTCARSWGRRPGSWAKGHPRRFRGFTFRHLTIDSSAPYGSIFCFRFYTNSGPSNGHSALVAVQTLSTPRPDAHREVVRTSPAWAAAGQDPNADAQAPGQPWPAADCRLRTSMPPQLHCGGAGRVATHQD